MKQSGYTLIEVLVSLIIFGFMVLLVSFAISQGLNQYKDVIHKTSNFWESAKILWLHKSFASTIDYFVKNEEWFPFFEGDLDKVIYITESPIAETLPVVAAVINERKDSGKRTLVYYEFPVYALNYREIKEFFTLDRYRNRKKIVLFDDLDSVEFEYFGTEPNRESHSWYSRFTGERHKALPRYLRLNLKKNNEKTSFIFEVRNNSRIKEIYNEIY